MNFWDERYDQPEYVYGTEPNGYFEEKIKGLPVGKALFIAEGEGRNAVHAATLGWSVDAFDSSSVAKTKALALARQKNVLIHSYRVSDVENLDLLPGNYDLLVFAYVHFLPEKRRQYFQKLANALKTGGYLILEGFSKAHIEKQGLNPAVGGPKNQDMLFDLEELKNDFNGFDFIEAYETETVLKEGTFHNGLSSVIRLFGTKGVS